MATQNVTDKILEDAKKESQDILKKFRDDTALIRKSQEEELHRRRSEIEEETDARKKGEHMRLLSQKKLEQNKDLAAHKREHLKKVITEALKTLPDHEKYGEFLQMLIAGSKERDGELIIRKEDWKKHRTIIEKFLKKEKADFTVTTQDEIMGGIVIKKGKTTYHGSLELISELLDDELAIAVSQALYGK
jgi:V/A-type H+-transporting ATPase subunit E